MYTVWTKDSYSDLWSREECDTDDEVKAAVLDAGREAREYRVTRPVEVEIEVKIKDRQPPAPDKTPAKDKKAQDKGKQEETVETKEDRPEEDKDPGGPGNSQV